ncbi:MAG: FixG Ig-like domain-containing protein [Anaerolineae bacterium]|nr:FixG Ig-like domain-containing protein [Anaerolineae bacterium]
MAHKRLVGRVLVILLTLLAAGVVSVVASTPVVALAPRGSVPAAVLVEAGWEQVNSNGFGDVDAGEVSALAPFNGFLYAGTHNATDGALILRSADGVTWNAVIDPGFGNPHDTAPPAILDLTVYNTYLYASTGRGDSAAKIFRTVNGLNWAPVVNSGFADQDNVDITALAAYSGKIYAGVTNLLNGAQIWRSYTGDSNSWTQDSPAALVVAPARITGFAVFDGALYAAVESDGPVQIWRTYGSGWAVVMDDGFGSGLTTLAGGMAVFGGSLYAGAGNTEDGPQLWRSNEGASWQPATAPGAADANNEEIESLFVFGGELYASVRNEVSGIEVWHSADGMAWEQSNADGFGDSDNAGTNQSNATAEFLGRLFVGTENVVDGGELWRLTPASLPSYGLALSAGGSLSGLPGTTVSHTLTITNTGTAADSYNLARSGNSWVSSLTTDNISLDPGASAQFGVAVSIPPGALTTESDTVSVTATSQGDATKQAISQLTTLVLPVYSVRLSPDQARGGLPGATVMYTLTVSNTGNRADSYDLDVAGNAWPAVLSATSVAVAPGASAQFGVAVSIPPGALTTESDTVSITATSQGDATKSATAGLTTTVLPLFGVVLSGGESLAGLPGATLTYTLTITNSGGTADSYGLGIAGNSWATTLSTSSVPLAPGASATVYATVSIPAGAADGASDAVTVTATSEGDSSVSDSATLTTTVSSTPAGQRRLCLPLLMQNGSGR